MSDRNPVHTGPADLVEVARESEQAGIADEGAAFTNAIVRDSAGAADNGAQGAAGAGTGNPAIGAGTAGDPGIADRKSTTIDLDDGEAAERWANRYSVTRAQLEEAVSAVGNDAHAVQTYLRGQGGGV